MRKIKRKFTTRIIIIIIIIQNNFLEMIAIGVQKKLQNTKHANVKIQSLTAFDTIVGHNRLNFTCL